MARSGAGRFTSAAWTARAPTATTASGTGATARTSPTAAWAGRVNGGNASGFGGALNALQQQQKQQQQQQRGGGGGVDGGVNGVGGLSAMFAGGMDIAGSPSLATGPSTQGITFGTGAPRRRVDKSSRGSSVRGGNAFGPGSFASASASSLPNAVSPVGSYDKDGLWSAMGGRAAAGGGGGPGTTSSSDPLDRAETPGISAAEAAHLLDSLEDAEDDVAAFVPFGGGRGSGVVDRSGPSIADRRARSRDLGASRGR